MSPIVGTEEQQFALSSRNRQRPASAAAGRGASVHRPPIQQVRSQAVGPSHLVTLHMRQQQKAGGLASIGAMSAAGSVRPCH